MGETSEKGQLAVASRFGSGPEESEMEGAEGHARKSKKSLKALRVRDFLEQSGIFIPIIRQIQEEIWRASFLLFSASFFSL